MKLIEALKNVNKSETNSKIWFDPNDGIGDILNIQTFNYDFETGNQHIKQYYVYKHLCTDTWVGLIAIYLDDELIGYSHQSARKNSVEYAFVSKEATIKLRDFILSCCSENDFPLIDQNEEINDYHNCYFSGQLLVPIGTEGTYFDEPATLIQPWSDRSNMVDTKIIVRDKSTGEDFLIPCEEFHYPLNVI